MLLVDIRAITKLHVIDQRVKDYAGPCDCIKDSDSLHRRKKTQIVSMSTLILCLLETSLPPKSLMFIIKI